MYQISPERKLAPLFFLAISGVSLLVAPASAADWPQWGGPRRDGVCRESALAETLPPTLRYRWRAPIGPGYAGPAVADGRVFVTARRLDDGESNPDNPFDRRAVGGAEHVLCLDEATGKEVWSYVYPCRYEISYPAGPRVTPTVDGERVYTVGAMGDLFCFGAATGKVVWGKDYAKDFGAEMQSWGVAAAPLIDGPRLIVLVGGRAGGLVIALDKRSGKEIWRALEEREPGYAPPIIVEVGGRRQLIVWTPSNVHSLDPETGAALWRQPFRCNAGLAVARPVFDAARDRLLVSAFYNGPLMLGLAGGAAPSARVLWRGTSDSERKTDKLHALMCTPVLLGEHIYGVCSYGQLRCLDATTGERVWETFRATGEGRWWNAFIVPQEGAERGRVYICNEQGDLIIARLASSGYEELSRSRLVEPTRKVQRRITVWSHPAFANRAIFARNDREIVCAELAASAYQRAD